MAHDLTPFAGEFRRGLIVSCQAKPGSPLDSPAIMAAMAMAAERAGAVGLRVNGRENIAAVNAASALPIIGINKIDTPGCDVRITPTYHAAHDIGCLPVKCIALDGTGRPRPRGETLGETIRRIREESLRLVMADVSTVEEGVAAAEMGADAIASTLSGYTAETQGKGEGPDLDLISALAERIDVPIIAEGRYSTPEQVTEAMHRGAHAVVVGTAITSPEAIAQPFAEAALSAAG